MREFESPRMLFQAFRQYFVWPPRLVIYDLACVLAKYALARNPSVFSGTVFALDKFHEVRGAILRIINIALCINSNYFLKPN
jgi:hypothetical protein